MPIAIAMIVAIVACSIVFILTGFSLLLTSGRLNHHSEAQGYRQVSCHDDEASDEEESISGIEETATSSPYMRLILGVAAVVSFIASICTLLLSTAQGNLHGLDSKRCIHTAAQALVALQSVLFLTTRSGSMEQRYDIGICIAISSLAIIVSLIFLNSHFASHGLGTSFFPDAIHAVACWAMGVAALSVPRGVTLYHRGQNVDAQHAVSAIEKYL